MPIGGLQKLTLIDFPGKLACTVFFMGCNFQCPWCYSKELVLPQEIKKHQKISEKNFLNFLKERKGLLEGVVLCGGEPTLNKGLPDFIKKIKKFGYLVKLDTNGSNPKALKNLIDKKLIDYAAMDIKVTEEKYPELFNGKIKIEDIKKSIEILKEGKIDYEFRTTVIPTIHTKEDIIKIANWLGTVKRYYLQNFKAEKTINKDFEKIRPYPKEYLLEIKRAISPFFESCQVR